MKKYDQIWIPNISFYYGFLIWVAECCSQERFMLLIDVFFNNSVLLKLVLDNFFSLDCADTEKFKISL